MDENQALERLHAILARPEFQVEQSRPWWEQLFGPLFGLVLYFVARLVHTVADATSGREGVFGVGVLIVVVLLVAFALVYLVRAVRLSVKRDSRVRAASLAERRERSERLWQTAQQLAAAGQFAEAARVVYLSALYALDERALLHVESSQTNREHARRLEREHPEVADTFGDVVETYDRLRYGQYPVSDQTFAHLNGLVARARAASLGGAVT
jgi:hypothetical protein